MRLEDSLRDVEIETVMLETVPSATQAIPRVILPERSSYSSAKKAVSRWTWGRCQPSPSLEPLYSLVSEPNSQHKPGWLWEVSRELSFLFFSSPSDRLRSVSKLIGKIMRRDWRRVWQLRRYGSLLDIEFIWSGQVKCKGRGSRQLMNSYTESSIFSGLSVCSSYRPIPILSPAPTRIPQPALRPARISKQPNNPWI